MVAIEEPFLKYMGVAAPACIICGNDSGEPGALQRAVVFLPGPCVSGATSFFSVEASCQKSLFLRSVAKVPALPGHMRAAVIVSLPYLRYILIIDDMTRHACDHRHISWKLFPSPRFFVKIKRSGAVPLPVWLFLSAA
jgi:hypothetical protein